MSQFGEFVSVSEAARLTNQTYWQVRRLIQKHRKEIQIERVGNSLMVRLADIWSVRAEDRRTK